MSSPNYSNPQVMRNAIISDIQEGAGEYEVKKEVIIYTSKGGVSFAVPDDLVDLVKKRMKLKVEKVEEIKTKMSEQLKDAEEAPLVIESKDNVGITDPGVDANAPLDVETDSPKEEPEEEKTETEANDDMSLEELIVKVEEKTGKKVVGKYRKDIEWLQNKLNS